MKGGFEKFNREVELDKSDEVDREVKDKISNEKWNVRTGNGFGPGFGNIGKGGENMRSDVVQFQKYKMTKDCFLERFLFSALVAKLKYFKTFIRVWLCISKGKINNLESMLDMDVGVYLVQIWIWANRPASPLMLLIALVDRIRIFIHVILTYLSHITWQYEFLCTLCVK